jgi:hypothetical protein
MPNLFPSSKYCFRQPGGIVPALGMAQSFWALSQREIPMAQALENACSEGFEFFEVGLREDRLTETKVLLNQFPLKLIAQGWATSAKDATVFLERAVEFKAIALNMHIGHAYLTTDEAADLVGDIQSRADVYGIPLLLETHRGRLTQDLFRTAELLARVPEIAITLDVSHYIVAGETLGGSEALFRAHMAPLLARTALIHGRISNGQSIQVPAEDGFAFTSVIQSLWQQAMASWLADAPHDAIFLFEPELGPPPYAYLNGNGAETFSRTAETRTLTHLARQAWAGAQAKINSRATV